MPDPAGAPISKRYDQYATLVEDIVLRGIEYPACELKRSVDLSKGDATDRLDFVKLVQGLANSHTDSETLIVIGADEKQRCFVDVDNADDFNAARLSPILAKYLSPEPRYTVFGDIRSSAGQRYVLIVLDRIQPRPIVCLVDGKTDSKTHFRPGDIWIKHNTALRGANKSDLDLMYQPMIEAEAQKRARIIFEHLKQELGPELISQAVTATPVPELLVGSRERLGRFTEAMISGGDPARFNMLLEMARHTIVERWRSFLQDDTTSYATAGPDGSPIGEFYRSEFLPTLTSVTDLGLNIVRYDAQPEWFGRVVDVLIDAFEISCHVDYLRMHSRTGDNSVSFARPAYEIFLAARTLATYAIFRNRYRFVGEILPRYVEPLTAQPQQYLLMPLLFWPFFGNLSLPDMKNGRNEQYWIQGIQTNWETFFGSESQFLDAAAQLELVLELNSYILIQYRSETTDRFRADFPEKYNAYTPDFYTTRLDPAMPMATRILNALMNGDEFPKDLSIERSITAQLFKTMSTSDREIFIGQFLSQLKKWQDEAMHGQMRFPFHTVWPPPLLRAIERSRELAKI